MLDKLSVNLLISNIIIINNDPINKSNKLIKTYTGKKDYDEIDNIIEQSHRYKDHITGLKEYFDIVFNKTKQEKMLLNYDKKIMEISNQSKKIILFFYLFIFFCYFLDNEINNSKLLNKKKKRDDDINYVKKQDSTNYSEEDEESDNEINLKPVAKTNRSKFKKPMQKSGIKIKKRLKYSRLKNSLK